MQNLEQIFAEIEALLRNSLSPDDYTIQPIYSEQYREYVHIPSGGVYRVDDPVALVIRKGGSTHRVIDVARTTHCIPFGALVPMALRWHNGEGTPVNF